jgi:hypothetical protein
MVDEVAVVLGCGRGRAVEALRWLERRGLVVQASSGEWMRVLGLAEVVGVG